MRFFTQFKRDNDDPLHQQLFEALKDSILHGRLQAGERLPSSRELAQELNLARNTVANAYDRLQSEGLIESVRGCGMYVSCRAASLQQLAAPLPAAPDYRLSKYADSVGGQEAASNALISYRLPRRQDLPTTKWHQLVLKHSKVDKDEGPAWCADVLGYLPLRQAISGYLRLSRAVACDAEHIVLFSSRREALDFWCKVLMEPGARMVMELPCHPTLKRLFEASAVKVEQVASDKQGLQVENLPVDGSVQAVYLTPSHQVVLGAIFSQERRAGLVEWARTNQAVIIEDDFDSEFVPVQSWLGQSIQGLDPNGNVVYVGSFSNSLSPLTEQAFAVVPDRLLSVVRRSREVFAGCAPSLEEKVLAEFIDSGNLVRHLKTLRESYARRRDRVCDELKSLSSKLIVDDSYTGTSLMVVLKSDVPARQIEIISGKAGLPMVSTTQFFPAGLDQRQFLLSFGRVPETDANEAVRLFEAYLKEAESSTGKNFAAKLGRLSLG